MGALFFTPGRKLPKNKRFSITAEGGGIKLNLSITITVPDRLGRFFIALLLLYRRARYGYPFRRIPLTQGKYAIVDPEDFERLNRHKWWAVKSGTTFYAVRTAGPRRNTRYVRMHREIIRLPDHLVADHINHNGLDNRKDNLRPATRAQNNYNRLTIRRKDSSSKYKGVDWKKDKKKWCARIYFNGKLMFLGYFKDEIQAAKAYDEAAKKYYGQFAYLNFKE